VLWIQLGYISWLQEMWSFTSIGREINVGTYLQDYSFTTQAKQSQQSLQRKPHITRILCKDQGRLGQHNTLQVTSRFDTGSGEAHETVGGTPSNPDDNCSQEGTKLRTQCKD
jgi:hypothetical protein